MLKEKGIRLPRFDKVGDVLPIEPITLDPVFQDLKTMANRWSENHSVSTLRNFQLIKRRKLRYDKPMLVIYNPNSGKKTNFVPKITSRLQAAKIPFEMMPTQKALDPLNFARTVDFGKYCMMVAAGGDGTVHEVVNGMLMREDKRRIPLAFLPNGSGDDLCSSIGILSMDHGLDYICKGETIKIDTLRVLVDHDSEETLPKGLERYDFCRHQMINSGLILPPLVAIKANYWKEWFGKGSYTIATIIEAIRGNLVNDTFELFIDEKPLGPEQSTLMLMGMNGKFCAGGMQILPYACINDGMADITWVSDPAVSSLLGIAGVMDKAKAGGV